MDRATQHHQTDSLFASLVPIGLRLFGRGRSTNPKDTRAFSTLFASSSSSPALPEIPARQKRRASKSVFRTDPVRRQRRLDEPSRRSRSTRTRPSEATQPSSHQRPQVVCTPSPPQTGRVVTSKASGCAKGRRLRRVLVGGALANSTKAPKTDTRVPTSADLHKRSRSITEKTTSSTHHISPARSSNRAMSDAHSLTDCAATHQRTKRHRRRRLSITVTEPTSYDSNITKPRPVPAGYVPATQEPCAEPTPVPTHKRWRCERCQRRFRHKTDADQHFFCLTERENKHHARRVSADLQLDRVVNSHFY